MKNITVESIPADLRRRIDDEKSVRDAEEKKLLRERMYLPVRFGTESDVSRFTDYSRDCDFLSLSDLSCVKIMVGSRALRFLLSVSAALRVKPNTVRLWVCSAKGKNSTFRANYCISGDKLTAELPPRSDSFFYVETISSADITDTLNEEKFEQLLADEKAWIEDLKSALSECGIADDYDVTVGCGIGSSNKPLHELNKCSSADALSLVKRINKLEDDAIKLLKLNHSPLLEDACLVFFRAFDPDSTLLCVPDPVPNESQESFAAQQGDEKGMLIPFKYLGSVVVQGTSRSLDLTSVVADLLKKFGDGHVPSCWENFDVSIWNSFGRVRKVLCDDKDRCILEAGEIHSVSAPCLSLRPYYVFLSLIFGVCLVFYLSSYIIEGHHNGR